MPDGEETVAHVRGVVRDGDKHLNRKNTIMTAKKKTAPMKTTAFKFEKGAWYEDAKGNVWVCANARTRKTPDGNQVIDM